MTPRIHLVRHGRSAHVHDGRWMRAGGVSGFESAYNAAGIRTDDAPPAELLGAANAAHVIAASDLPRAIASAQRLAPGRELAVSPLLREIELEPPRWIPIPLPIEVWDVFSHLQWTYRLMIGADHEYVRRANDAADWLVARAGSSSAVVAVTHGGFRRIIADRLVARGWSAGEGRRSYANWSTWSYAPTSTS